jgi:hypothetical protein
MVGSKRGFASEEVWQDAKHTLFVEGNESSIDSQVLGTLFTENEIDIPIVPLGNSSNLRTVARALYQYHPYYYFLIDRDHHDDEIVEKCWKKFPDESTHNLLIWRRREIENYFLIPEYLARSPYCQCSPEKLQQCIRETASKRAYLDIANIVILQLRAELRKDWIEPFKDTGITEFSRRDATLAKLMEKHENAKQTCDVLEQLHEYPIFDRFNETIDKFFGGQDELEFGRGSWLKMIKGKQVLPTVIDKCFRVPDRTGKYLQGNERCMEVVKSLLKLPLENQPSDFYELYKLISARVSKRT